MGKGTEISGTEKGKNQLPESGISMQLVSGMAHALQYRTWVPSPTPPAAPWGIDLWPKSITRYSLINE